MIGKSCAFTGHRPKSFPWRYNEMDARCVALKETLAGQIARLADSGITEYLSGMAEAVDTWAALSVLALREKNPALRLHCILPCKSQADKWNTQARELYRSILDRSDSIVWVNRAYTQSCMLERNRFLVSHAAILLAVYNGSQRSGTAATVNYARRLGREIIVIDPITRLISHEESVPSPAHP